MPYGFIAGSTGSGNIPQQHKTIQKAEQQLYIKEQKNVLKPTIKLNLLHR